MRNLNRLSIPDLLPGQQRDPMVWFLENFETQYLYGSYWNNPAPWFVKKRQIMDNFVVFPNSPMYIETDFEQKVVDRGEFFIIPTGFSHCYGLDPETAASSEHVILHVLFNSNIFINPLEVFPSHFHNLENYDLWYEKMKKIIHLHDFSPAAEKKYAETLVTELMLELLRLEASEVNIPENRIDPRIELVLKYVKRNYNNDLVMEDLADMAGLRQVQFRKLFKRDTGRSPKQYLTLLRIHKASEMLRRTNIKIREISEQTGFNDKNYFSTAFKQVTGLSPSEFREQEKKP